MKRIYLFASIIMLSTFLMAQEHEKQKEKFSYRQKSAKNHLDRFGLTEKQKNEIKALKLAHMKASQSVKNNLEIRKAELNAALSSDKVNKQEVDKLVKEINTLKGKLFENQISTRMNVRDLLDDKQKIQFDQKKVQYGEFHKEREIIEKRTIKN